MTQLFIGLMSGTSVDGVDIAVADFETGSPKLVAAQCVSYPEDIRQGILALFTPSSGELDRLGELDATLGAFYGSCVQSLLETHGIAKANVAAIGSHGQTIRHRPAAAHPFTLQIGNPHIIAETSGITTIADFRRRDMALGGQGAPFAPLFHDMLFREPGTHRCIANIGGIANITCLPANGAAWGFDTGPGNGLMDYWHEKRQGDRLDKNGSWAASGQVDADILAGMLDDAYFAAPAPKSTGKEYFTGAWLENHLSSSQALPCDVQRTLLELTARTLTSDITEHFPDCQELYVCGGGAHNRALMARLNELFQGKTESTETLGINPDWVEAIGFAWLARQYTQGIKCDTTRITGATKPCMLGVAYPA